MFSGASLRERKEEHVATAAFDHAANCGAAGFAEDEVPFERAADLNTTTGVFSTQGADLIQAYTASEVDAVSRSVDVSSVCNTGSSFTIRITVPTGRFQIDYRHQKPRTAKRRSGVLRFYEFNLVSKCLAQMKLRFLLYLLYRLTANSPRYQTKYRCFLPRSGLSKSSDHHQTGLSMSNR